VGIRLGETFGGIVGRDAGRPKSGLAGVSASRCVAAIARDRKSERAGRLASGPL